MPETNINHDLFDQEQHLPDAAIINTANVDTTITGVS